LASILFFIKLFWTVHMNFHAKSGVYSSKNEWVMLNLVFGDCCRAYDQPTHKAARFAPASNSQVWIIYKQSGRPVWIIYKQSSWRCICSALYIFCSAQWNFIKALILF
jgi:hypothetical protein